MGQTFSQAKWHTSLYDCCHSDSLPDLLLCLLLSPMISNAISYGFLLSKMNKNTCEIAFGVALMLLIPECACFFAGPTRTEIRKKYNLEEEPCPDVGVHFCGFLTPCALCQERREIDHRQGFEEPKMDGTHSMAPMPPPPPQVPSMSPTMYSGHPPPFYNTAPYGAAPPSYGGAPPAYNAPPPYGSAPPPYYGPPPPAYGAAPPYGATPPPGYSMSMAPPKY